jgi:hypothetical protein
MSVRTTKIYRIESQIKIGPFSWLGQHGNNLVFQETFQEVNEKYYEEKLAYTMILRLHPMKDSFSVKEAAKAV